MKIAGLFFLLIINIGLIFLTIWSKNNTPKSDEPYLKKSNQITDFRGIVFGVLFAILTIFLILKEIF